MRTIEGRAFEYPTVGAALDMIRGYRRRYGTRPAALHCDAATLEMIKLEGSALLWAVETRADRALEPHLEGVRLVEDAGVEWMEPRPTHPATSDR